MSTIAIFGAGPALGTAVARRFGREGFRVGLVARDQRRLDDLVTRLADEGIEAAAFSADLADQATTVAAAEAIERRFGPVDVLAYNAVGQYEDLRRKPSQIDIDVMSRLADTFVLTPVALVSRLLPGMVERGDGALLFAMGAAAKYPFPDLASAGMVAAGLRSYVHTLNAELAPQHVYAGDLVIGALIEGSAAHRNAAAWGTDLAVVSPDDLAERYWNMYLKRDRIEDEVDGAGQTG